MTEVAGEVCDGFICHGFTTERYLREVTIPALQRGRAKAGKDDLEGFEIVGPVVRGHRHRRGPSWPTPRQGTRQQIAFYGSTPAYRPVLDLHGWGGLQDELNTMSKQGKWVEMGDLIDDEILNTFAVVGEPEQIAPELQRRYGDVIERISLLHAVPVRPGALAEGAGRPPGRLTVEIGWRPVPDCSAGGRRRTTRLGQGRAARVGGRVAGAGHHRS